MPAKWQQWYPHDIDAWQGSSMIQSLSHAGYRAYHNLIQKQYQSEDGMLPINDRELAKLSRIGDDWKSTRKEVLACFTRTGNRLFSPRQYTEWTRANTVHQKRLEAADATNKRRRTVTATVTAHAEQTVTERSPAHNTVHRQDNTKTEELRATTRAPESESAVPVDNRVDAIVCAHPRSQLRNLQPNEVRQRDQAAVLEAMMAEIQASGGSHEAVLEMMLDRTHILANEVPRSEWRFFKDVSEFYRSRDYRLEPRDFMRGSNAKTGNDSAPASTRVSKGVAAARAAAQRSAEAAGGRAASEHGGGVSAPVAGPGDGNVPDGPRGSGDEAWDGEAADGTARAAGSFEVLPPSSRNRGGA